MGWRRFIPGKRKNRREDQVIRAIPISDAGPLLHEDDTDPETSSQYHTQPQYVPYWPHSSSIAYILLF